MKESRDMVAYQISLCTGLMILLGVYSGRSYELGVLWDQSVALCYGTAFNEGYDNLFLF